MRFNSYVHLFGYTGKLLRIDLSKDKVSVEEINHELLRKYMGGVGYGAKLLYDELRHDFKVLILQIFLNNFTFF